MGVGSGGNGGNISPLRNGRGGNSIYFSPLEFGQEFSLLARFHGLIMFDLIGQRNHLVLQTRSNGVSILTCLLSP